MKLRSLICMILATGSVLALSQAEWLSQAKGRFVTEVLPNGLTVVCYPMPGQHEVRVGVTYDVGAKDELPGEYGLAHMIEHMIFKGTEKMSETDLKAIAEKFCVGDMGVGYQAYTARDRTAYYFNTDKDNYGVFLDILADCMFNVRFDEDHFASEVKAVIEEINLRQTMNMGMFMYDTLSAMTYPLGHPYHHSIIGYKESLLKKTAQDLKAFYKRNYHPSKALLTIIGDIDVEKACALARHAFDQQVAPPEVHEIKERPILTEGLGRKKVVAYKPIAQPEYFYCWRIPADDKSTVIAEGVSDILTHRLQKVLVREKDLVLSVSSSILPERLGGFFFIIFSPKTDRSVKVIKDEIQHELERLMDDGPTDIEVLCLKKDIDVGILHQLESPSGVGALLERYYFPVRSVEGLFKQLALIHELTVDDVSSFIKHHLRPLLRYTVACLALPEHEKEHWLAMKTEEDTYEKAILDQKIRNAEVEPVRLAHSMPEPIVPSFSTHVPDKIFTLSNGLKVCVKRREATPFMHGLISFAQSELLGYTLGKLEKQFESSYAFSFMNNGTIGMNPDEVREFFTLHGATCSFDNGCSFSCVPDEFMTVMPQIITLMKQPAYNEQLLKQDIQATIQQMQAKLMNPFYMMGRLVSKELFKGIPWFKTDEQQYDMLQRITREKIIAFNEEYIRPDMMLLVLVGNIDLATIERDLEKAVREWKAPKTAPAPLLSKENIPVLMNPKEKKEIIHAMPVDQVVLAFARITTYDDTLDMDALSIIESYLNKKLFSIREATGLFYSSFCHLTDGGSIYQKGVGLVFCPLSVNNVEQGEKAIREALKEVAQQGVPQEFIAKMKEQRQMAFVKSFRTNDSYCVNFAQLLSEKKPWDTFEKRLARFTSLTKKQVDEVAKKYLDPAEWTTVKAGRIDGDGSSGGGLLSWLF